VGFSKHTSINQQQYETITHCWHCHHYALTMKLKVTTKMSICADTEYKVALEGKVIQRAECRPVENAGYMAMKR